MVSGNIIVHEALLVAQMAREMALPALPSRELPSVVRLRLLMPVYANIGHRGSLMLCVFGLPMLELDCWVLCRDILSGHK